MLTAPVITLTLNPAIDLTVTLPALKQGAVNRAETYRAEAGGKGINVAATLASGGIKAAATGILGRDNAAFFQKFFTERGIENGFLYVRGAARSNIKLVSAAETTDINLPGLPADPALLEDLYQLLAAAKSRFLVLAGSLPPQCPDSFYADFLSFYAGQNGAAKIIADCSGKPLKALLSGAIRPFCIKPNQDELAEWAGKALPSRKEILAQAVALHKTGIALTTVSLGAQGALFVAGNAAYHAAVKLEKVESTVGAGDAMVAGIAAALLQRETDSEIINSAELENIAKTASLWAAGKLLMRGAALPPQERLQALAQNLRCEKLI